MQYVTFGYGLSFTEDLGDLKRQDSSWSFVLTPKGKNFRII